METYLLPDDFPPEEPDLDPDDLSFRNRCYILSAHGPQLVSVPVYLGSQHKTPLKEIRID